MSNNSVQTLADLRRPSGESSPLDALLAQPRSTRFDPDAYHAMQERDSALIADSVLNGYSGREYVYDMTIKGERVTGISVVGARALAAEYKGIKTRLVSAIDKNGPLFIMRTFDPPSMQVQHIPELASHPDFYEVVLEVTDLKTGNSIQPRKREEKFGRRRDGGTFERPHYDVVAESKAFRNGVLAIIPQDVVSQFEARALSAGNSGKVMTKSDRIAGALKYAAKNGISIDRVSLESLTTDQISGLSDAARDGAKEFRTAAESLGLVAAPPADMDPETGEIPAPQQPKAARLPVSEIPVNEPAQTPAAATIPTAVDALLTLFAETETVAALDGLGRDANKLIKQYPECADAIKNAGSKRRAALLSAEKKKSAPDDAGIIGSDFGDFE